MAGKALPDGPAAVGGEDDGKRRVLGVPIRRHDLSPQSGGRGENPMVAEDLRTWRSP
jgi:hypothetical protein